MRRIFKYKLDVGLSTKIELPEGSEILSVGTQGHDVFFWALVHVDQKPRTRMFMVLGTGAQVPSDVNFIGAVHFHDMGEVYHVFEDVTPDLNVAYEIVI
ncbi:DUF7352 domain-containing protein [Vibrio cholerae]